MFLWIKSSANPSTTTQQAWGPPWEPGVLGGVNKVGKKHVNNGKIPETNAKYVLFAKPEPRIEGENDKKAGNEKCEPIFQTYTYEKIDNTR